MIDLGRLLRATSVLVGLVVAGLVLGALYPFPPEVGLTVGAAAFLGGAGIAELISRLLSRPRPPKSGAPDEV